MNAPQQGYPPQQGSGYPGAQAHYQGQGQSYPPPQGPPSQSSPAPARGPSPLPPAAAGGASSIPTNGSFDGITYNIAHRDSNSLLSVRLPPGYELKAKPGSMVAMDASVKIQGKVSSKIFRRYTLSDRHQISLAQIQVRCWPDAHGWLYIDLISQLQETRHWWRAVGIYIHRSWRNPDRPGDLGRYCADYVRWLDYVVLR